jgi:excisionase family DNA binding protein
VYVTDVSVSEAARRLAVHPSRVRSLIATGQLQARRIGAQWVLDDADLEERKGFVAAGATSRALSTRVAWAAAALLDGDDADWLTTSERSRLRARLRAHDAEEWQTYRRWLGSRHSAVTRFRVADSDVTVLLAREGVVAAGLSAAGSYQLGLGTSGHADAYVSPAVLAELVEEFFLIESAVGKLRLRTVDGDWHLRTAQSRQGECVAARLMVAVDLLDEGDARSHQAGFELLQTLLSGSALVRAEQ